MFKTGPISMGGGNAPLCPSHPWQESCATSPGATTIPWGSGTEPGPLLLGEGTAPWARCSPSPSPALPHPHFHTLPSTSSSSSVRHLQPVLGSPQVPVPQSWKVPSSISFLPGGNWGAHISPVPQEPLPVLGMVPVVTLCLLGSSALLLSTTPGAQGKAEQQLCSSGAFLTQPCSSSPLLLSSLSHPCAFPWREMELGIAGGAGHRRA